MYIAKGATRCTIVTKYLAFKFPRFCSWKAFLEGLLTNMIEVNWKGFDSVLCPILFHVPGGFLVVMPTAVPLSERLEENDYHKIVDPKHLPIENKADSFGYLRDGRFVAIDYGDRR